MSSCNTCPSASGCTQDSASCMVENNVHNQVKNVIAVMSGKGGVGKSTVTALLAKKLTKLGYKVGVLDADVTGPSIPRLFGIKNGQALSTEYGAMPVMSSENIATMSLNYLVDDEESPVLWRGPIISGTVKQFWTDVYWGELDYLLIDMPPGTGDVSLTVMQSIPLTGAVVVSTPHDMVSMIVAKSINMAKKMNVPILGLVQNMSYVLCPDCTTKIELFEKNDIESYLKRLDIKLLGELPMSSKVANMSSHVMYETEIHACMDSVSDKVIEFVNSKKATPVRETKESLNPLL